MSARPATPPTAPPAIAPVFVSDESDPALVSDCEDAAVGVGPVEVGGGGEETVDDVLAVEENNVEAVDYCCCRMHMSML